MNTDKKYNGWTNYETWLFNLWHDDAFGDQAQEAWDEAEADDTFSREENAALALADSISSFADEFIEVPESGFLADITRSAMQEINFHEIAQHYIIDVDKEEDPEKIDAAYPDCFAGGAVTAAPPRSNYAALHWEDL
jgi:hypothetical protein